VSSFSPLLRDRWEAIAVAALTGVGDARLGEWREGTRMAFHLRRRLTRREMAMGHIDDVIDIRQTDEAARRIQRIRPFLPPPLATLPDELLP